MSLVTVARDLNLAKEKSRFTTSMAPKFSVDESNDNQHSHWRGATFDLDLSASVEYLGKCVDAVVVKNHRMPIVHRACLATSGTPWNKWQVSEIVSSSRYIIICNVLQISHVFVLQFNC